MTQPDPGAESPDRQSQFILDLEARQDEVIKQLDELEARIAAVLAEETGTDQPPAETTTGDDLAEAA